MWTAQSSERRRDDGAHRDVGAAATEARHRASEAEERATELSEGIDGLTTTAHLRDETTAGGEVSGDRATVSQLEEALQVIRSRVQELEVELAAVEEARQAVTAGIAEIATDRDRVREQAELERYRALEEARRNWEAREARLYARLEAVEEELRSSKTAAYGRASSRAR